MKTISKVWGKYPNYQDIARLEYARILWKKPSTRDRLRTHWLDPKHPYSARFRSSQKKIEALIESQESEEDLQQKLLEEGGSLRTLIREIPPVFGNF